MIARFSAYGFLKNLQFFEPFLYLYFLAKGLSFFQIGVLIAVRSVTVYVLEIPTGVMADMFGKKRAMLLCFASYIASFAVFGLVSHFGLLACAMVLFGLGEAFRTGTHKAIIMDYLDQHDMMDRKTHVYGYTRSWSKIGSAVNAVVAAAIVYLTVDRAGADYSIVFLASIVPYIAGLILIFTYPADHPEKATAKSLTRQVTDHCREAWRAFKLNARLLLNSTLFDSAFKCSKDFIQPVIRAAAVSLPLLTVLSSGKRTALIIGGVYLCRDIISALFARMAGRFKERIGHSRRGEDAVFLAAGILYLLMALGLRIHLAVVIVIFLLLIACENIRRPLIVAHIGDSVAKPQRATILSVESMLTTIAVAVLAPAVGYLADRFAIEWVYIVCGGLLLLSFLPLRLHRGAGPAQLDTGH